MKVQPLGDRVLVEPLKDEETSKGGIIIPDSAKEKPQQAEVISVGQGRITKSGDVRALTVKVGDTVLFAKYSGNEIKIDGAEHLILREEDILAIVD